MATGPSPLELLTLNSIVLLPNSVTPSQPTDVPETLLVISVQVAPPSSEPNRVSLPARAWLRVAVMVCPATLVMKSLALAPESAEMSMPEIVVLGGPSLSVPQIVMVTTLLAVPSRLNTVKVSVSVSPAPSACTAGRPLLSA